MYVLWLNNINSRPDRNTQVCWCDSREPIEELIERDKLAESITVRGINVYFSDGPLVEFLPSKITKRDKSLNIFDQPEGIVEVSSNVVVIEQEARMLWAKDYQSAVLSKKFRGRPEDFPLFENFLDIFIQKRSIKITEIKWHVPHINQLIVGEVDEGNGKPF